MSKSTLSITVIHPNFPGATVGLPRTIEVPCRLPEAFTFSMKTVNAGVLKTTAYLSGLELSAGEFHDADRHDLSDTDATRSIMAAHTILVTIKVTLGITGPVPPGSPLPAIALAYEAEVAAYDAAVKAHAALPRVLHSLALLPTHPAENDYSPAVLMLRKYVEHVVEQACKAQTERAEQAAKVTP